MLRLERMDVSGFKSFSDRTEARFPDGITAVVGPNGCGKSNLGDAINWVLGEQSPKNLRGKQMLDVIFNGSAKRKPKGMAEVSLHLKNIATGVPDDRVRTVITRRLFRSGESEYLINGKRCRLRDIQEMLRSEHVGAKTYATIEQGRIDHILNSKPKERRLIIEDAAGVSGFKHKRRLAELKLEATHANLLRVTDIITEVTRQINSLKRQASKARRYQRLRGELRDRERVLFGVRAGALDDALRDVRDREATIQDEAARIAAELATLEAETGDERLALEEAERDHRRDAEDLHRMEIEIDRKESRIQHCREKIADADAAIRRTDSERVELEASATSLHERRGAHAGVLQGIAAEVEGTADRMNAEQQALDGAVATRAEIQQRIEAARRAMFDSMNAAADLRNRRRGLEEAIERNAATRSRLDTDRTEAREALSILEGESASLSQDVERHVATLEELERDTTRLQADLTDCRNRLEADRESLSAARQREQSAAARLSTLEDVATRFAGVSDGVRMLLTDGETSGLRTHGVIADFVEAGREIEGVAESYLQSLLPAVIVDDATDARTAAAMLREGDAGRTTLVCRNQPVGAVAVGTPSNGRPAVPDEILRDERVLGRLRERLTLHTRMNGVLEDRIGDAVLVDTLASALDLHGAYPHVDYLAASGEVVYASGLVSAGGERSGDHGLLAHNRHVHEARGESDAARGEISVLEESVTNGGSRLAALDAAVVERRAELEQAGRRRVELELHAQRYDDERARAGRRNEVLSAESAQLGDEAERLRTELTAVISDVEAAETDHGEVETRLEGDREALVHVEARLDELNEKVAALRADVAAGRQRLASAEAERDRLDERVAEVEDRLRALRQESDGARARRDETRELLATTESELAGDVVRRQDAAATIREQAAGIEQRRESLAQRDESLRGRRQEHEAVRERVREVEMERAGIEADRRHLDDLCVQELGMAADQAIAEAGEAMADPELDPDAVETEVAEIKGKIERIGPVNMMAIDEFSELEERHVHLATQKDDLEKSMESLRETIRKINRQSRERFQGAFEAIRANYREIFQVLFNGGRADLRLEEGEDVLECGIEILAQPPGKRLTNVQLLSGGEKAMSAIALLFAIFRYQPSPFCLLDEVDAALDDVNVGRFTRLLGEYAAQTQFILVTHNKVSMDSAHLLYGVTMEEPGVSRLVSLRI